jgi:hypothetical protein
VYLCAEGGDKRQESEERVEGRRRFLTGLLNMAAGGAPATWQETAAWCKLKTDSGTCKVEKA